MTDTMEHAGSPELVKRTLLLIAKKQFPFGAIAKCQVCTKSNEVTMERVAEIMQDWPTHCDREIRLTEKK